MLQAIAHLVRRGAPLAVLLAAGAVRAAEEVGNYQGDSVRSFSRGSQGLWRTLRQSAAHLYVTPARAVLVLGVAGALYTFTKNKHLFHWGLLAAVSYALAALGVAAMYYGWPSMN